MMSTFALKRVPVLQEKHPCGDTFSSNWVLMEYANAQLQSKIKKPMFVNWNLYAFIWTYPLLDLFIQSIKVIDNEEAVWWQKVTFRLVLEQDEWTIIFFIMDVWGSFESHYTGWNSSELRELKRRSHLHNAHLQIFLMCFKVLTTPKTHLLNVKGLSK